MRYINLFFIIWFLCNCLFFEKVYSQNSSIELSVREMRDAFWSPNGRELVFSRYPLDYRLGQGGRWNFFGIYKINSDGTGLTTLYQRDGEGAEHPVFSPDGTKVAFTIRKDFDIATTIGTIWIMDSNGGNLRQVTTESQYIRGLSWSFDGSTIIYDAFDVYTVKADGSTPPTKLNLQDGLYGYPVLSNDGKYLAVYGVLLHLIDRDRFWIVDYSTGKILNRFYDGDVPVYWSNDNSKVVCRRSIINVSDGSFVPLPVPGMLSPDGTKIFYEVDAGRAGWNNYVMFLDTPILLNQQK